MESSFVINNNGYTIERLIHGMEASYNDITPWQHTLLLQVFGAPADQQRSCQVRTKKELEALLSNDEFINAPYIQVGFLSAGGQNGGLTRSQLVELFMPQTDAPRALIKVGETTAKRNSELAASGHQLV